jgi:F420-dependent oxidoreductase-like protein
MVEKLSSVFSFKEGDLVRFAFTAAQSNCTWAELAELWDVADDLDVFTTGWVYDHFYPLRTGPEEPTLEGWTCLAMLLARTGRLRGGVLVTGIPYRHPAVLTKMAVTVDIASGGRLELGLGAGWFEPECQAYGIELGSIAERFDRFEEALAVIHSLLTRPTTSVDGRYYRLRDAWCEPKAAQEPHPPIVLGGKGERRLLPLVARFADHWNYSGDDVDEFVRLRARLAELCEAEGRTIDDLTLSANVRPTADGPPELAEQAAAYGEAGAGLVCVLLPRPYDPRLLEQLAPALAPLR